MRIYLDQAVNRAIGREGRWLAAMLACGDGAVLSHRSAASLWRIREGEGPRPVTQTRLEDRMLALCDRHGTPRLLTQQWVLGRRVDFFWPGAR